MLKTAKIAAVRTVLTAAPYGVLRSLEAALRSDGGAGPSALVRDLIEAEISEREACEAVLAPLTALCRVPAHPAARQLFPRGTPMRLWTALKTVASEDTQAVIARALQSGDSSPEDRLCLRAAAGVRAAEAPFDLVLGELQPGGAERLALALELAPSVRDAAAQLPAWLTRATGAQVAAMRLTYKDAAQLGDDAGPLLIEMLLARMDEPWRVLELVSWIMDSPGERFVAESELAGVALRVIEAIDLDVAEARDADFAKGAAAGLRAGRAVARGLAAVRTVQAALSLKRGPWADRVKRQRAALVGVADTRLREAESLVGVMLPAPPLKLAGRSLGGGGRYNDPPDPALLSKGRGLLTFLSEIHGASELGGFGALWARTAKAVDDRLATAADELIGMLHAGMGDVRPLQRHLDAAAELTTLACGPQAGRIVRRRAAAA